MRPSTPRVPRLLRGYRPLRPGPDTFEQRSARARLRSRLVAAPVKQQHRTEQNGMHMDLFGEFSRDEQQLAGGERTS